MKSGYDLAAVTENIGVDPQTLIDALSSRGARN
jgi:hypothetical protein